MKNKISKIMLVLKAIVSNSCVKDDSKTTFNSSPTAIGTS